MCIFCDYTVDEVGFVCELHVLSTQDAVEMIHYALVHPIALLDLRPVKVHVDRGNCFWSFARCVHSFSPRDSELIDKKASQLETKRYVSLKKDDPENPLP